MYMTGLSFNSNNTFKTSQSAILDEIIYSFLRETGELM